MLAVDERQRQLALDALQDNPEARARAQGAIERFSQGPVTGQQAPVTGQQAIAASRVITPGTYVVECITVTFHNYPIHSRPPDVMEVIEEGGIVVFNITRVKQKNVLRIFCYVDQVDGGYDM